MTPKFRAFCKRHKCIEDVFSITYLCSNDIKVEAECLSGYVGRDFIMMQSTGLRDKNGVEIFEGDVVNINHTFRNPMTGSGTLTLNKNFEVVYINGMFAREGSSMGLSRDLEYITVIGNVHENQELLEDV